MGMELCQRFASIPHLGHKAVAFVSSRLKFSQLLQCSYILGYKFDFHKTKILNNLSLELKMISQKNFDPEFSFILPNIGSFIEKKKNEEEI